MKTENWQHLEIRENNPAAWQMNGGRENVLLVGLNMPGYYSLPVRMLSLIASTSDSLTKLFNTRYIEGSIRESTDRLLAVISVMQPDILAFSVNIWNRQLVEKLAGSVKKILPETVVLGGGQEVTNSAASPLLTLAHFDYIIDGEGEIPFQEFLREWDSSRKTLGNPENVSGLHYFRQDSAPHFTRPAEIIDDLDDLPSVILAGLIDPGLCTKKLGVMIEGARGCPFRCGYCFEGGYNRKVRSASIKRVMAEMQYMVDRGAGYFHLMDPVLCNSNPRRLQEISEYFTTLRKERKGSILLVEAYAQHITEEMAGLLKQGFIVDIGLQTVNEQTNKAITRPFDRERFSKGMSYLQKSGASSNIYLICGLPHETMESFLGGIVFALAQNPTKIFINELQLLNGTLLRRQALDLGYEFNPQPPYDIYATGSMSRRSIQITLAAARTLGRSYNLNGRSIYASAPWFASPNGPGRPPVTLDLASPCSHQCPGCRQGGRDGSEAASWRQQEKEHGSLSGRDITLRVGNRVADKLLLQLSGGLPLASVLRTKICAPVDFLESVERVDRLFQSGVWHYLTFLTAPPSNDHESAACFAQDLARLESLNRALPLPGAAVLEPYLEIRLLTGKADPKGYLQAIEQITNRRPTVITVPRELEGAGEQWRAVLIRAFDACATRGHWLKLPEKMMRDCLQEEYNEKVLAYLHQLDLISTTPDRPPCFVEAEIAPETLP